MKLNAHPPTTVIDSPNSDLLDPLEIIDAMLDLRTQLVELQQQVEALQPAFYAACAALQLEKITTDRLCAARSCVATSDRATISRRLTPRVVAAKIFCIAALVRLKGCGNRNTYSSQMAVVSSNA